MSKKHYARVVEIEDYNGVKALALELDYTVLTEMNFVDNEILEIKMDKENRTFSFTSTNTISPS